MYCTIQYNTVYNIYFKYCLVFFQYCMLLYTILCSWPLKWTLMRKARLSKTLHHWQGVHPLPSVHLAKAIKVMILQIQVHSHWRRHAAQRRFWKCPWKRISVARSNDSTCAKVRCAFHSQTLTMMLNHWQIFQRKGEKPADVDDNDDVPLFTKNLAKCSPSF